MPGRASNTMSFAKINFKDKYELTTLVTVMPACRVKHAHLFKDMKGDDAGEGSTTSSDRRVSSALESATEFAQIQGLKSNLTQLQEDLRDKNMEISELKEEILAIKEEKEVEKVKLL